MFRKPKTWAWLVAVCVLIVGSSHAQYTPPSGSTGGGAWGSISGTLSSQTDLWNILLGKAPLASPALTGAVTVITGVNTKGPVVTGTTSTSTSSGNGASAQEILLVQGADGQTTTHAAANSQGGTGSQLRILGGNGGDNTDSNATSASNHKAGDGGLAEIISGGGGAGGGTGHARGGAGGTVSILGGQGGASANDNAGNGAAITIQPGDGGTTGAAAVGGTGGGLTIRGGIGGDTNGGTNGTGGAVTIDAGGAGSGGSGGAEGVVAIGTNNAASVEIGQSGVTTNIRGNVSMPNAVVQPYLTLGGQAYGPLSAITPPPLLNALTWVNQGGATAVQNVGGNAILMSVPSGSGDSIRYLHTAAYPTTPYTFTIGIKLWMPNSDFQGHGIAISDGTKFAGFGLGHNSVTGAVAYTFATATSDGATIGGIPITALLASNEWYVSITDDGTTITVKQGPNPLVMVTIGSATRSTLGITPTQVGIYMDNRNASLTAQALFFHWAFN